MSPSNLKISKTQIQKIHIAKKQLKLNDETYREMLSGYGVASSKDLTYKQAEDLLRRLEASGWKPTGIKPPAGIDEKKWGKQKFEDLKGRGEEYAAPQQLRMIEARWKDVTGNEPDKGLNKFIKRVVNIDSIEWLRQSHVKKVLKALDEWESWKKNK